MCIETFCIFFYFPTVIPWPRPSDVPLTRTRTRPLRRWSLVLPPPLLSVMPVQFQYIQNILLDTADEDYQIQIARLV